MEMLLIEVLSVLPNGRRVVRQRVIDVPAVFVKKPVHHLKRYAVPMIHSLDVSMPRNFDTGIIVASAKGGHLAKMMSGKNKDATSRVVDHKRQHKPDHRRANVYR